MSQQDSNQLSPLPFSKKEALPRIRAYSANGKRAQQLLRKHSLIAGGLGFIAGPIELQISIAALLAKLLHDMSRLYGLSFSDNQSKILISAILGGVHSHWINRYLLKLTRYTPISIYSANLILRPTITSLIVYYIGKLFLIHFETGIWKQRIN